MPDVSRMKTSGDDVVMLGGVPGAAVPVPTGRLTAPIPERYSDTVSPICAGLDFDIGE